jgi:membrane protease YdiL (CAAX protease family)
MDVGFTKTGVASKVRTVTKTVRLETISILAKIESDKLTLLLLYSIAFAAVDPVGTAYYIGAIAITACLFQKPPKSIIYSSRKTNWAVIIGFCLFPIAANAFAKILPFPWGGWAYYYYPRGHDVGSVGIFPGLCWTSLLVVSLVWLVYPRQGIVLPRAIGSRRLRVLLLALMVAPVLLRKMFLSRNMIPQYAAIPTDVVLLSAFVQLYVTSLFEELYFRGFLFSMICRRTGAFSAAVLSGLVFAMSHFNSVISFANSPNIDDALELLRVFMLGTMLCFVFHRTKSFFIIILYHTALNAAFLFAICLYRISGG